jgi:hypothetical protein
LVFPVAIARGATDRHRLLVNQGLIEAHLEDEAGIATVVEPYPDFLFSLDT